VVKSDNKPSITAVTSAATADNSSPYCIYPFDSPLPSFEPLEAANKAVTSQRVNFGNVAVLASLQLNRRRDQCWVGVMVAYLLDLVNY